MSVAARNSLENEAIVNQHSSIVNSGSWLWNKDVAAIPPVLRTLDNLQLLSGC